MMARRRSFGSVRKLSSGRYQARYYGTDGRQYTARTPFDKPLTFETRADADAWLALRQSEIVRGAWRPVEPKPEVMTLQSYADAWLTDRQTKDGHPLAQTTLDHYGQVLRDYIYPRFGKIAVTSIAAADVRRWYAGLKTKTGPTARAHAYGLLRTILNTAVADELIDGNPCRIRGAGQSKRAREVRPATLDELEIIAITVPHRYRLMILLAAWCAMRFGELAELRRSDVDAAAGVIWVRRGVTRTKGRHIVKGPKSESGKRDVNIPPHLMSAVRDHLNTHVTGRNGLLFPSSSDPQKHMQPSTLYKVYYPARKAAGREDLRFHDLRHTGATMAAATGATLRELMDRLGHSSPSAALRYQHATAERDKAIAQALSEIALKHSKLKLV